jgi:hypothetical protein
VNLTTIDYDQGRLDSTIGPREKQCTGAPPYADTNGNKIILVHQIKHIFMEENGVNGRKKRRLSMQILAKT